MKLLFVKPIGSSLNISSAKCDIETITFDPEQYKNKLDEFVESLSNRSFDGVIIPDTLDETTNYLGLEICIRIRVVFKLIKERAYASLFILNSKMPQEIFRSQIAQKSNTTASIFFTEGTFSFQDADFANLLIEKETNYNILNEENFKELFLDVIQIKKSSQFGNHTIANVWGALRLAEVTGNSQMLENYFEANKSFKASQSDLYFKLLLSKSLFLKNAISSNETINSAGKNVLLIDDESDKGWEVLLRAIFVNANFEIIHPGSSFISDARSKAMEKHNGISKWDLILLDLRLEENEDLGENANKVASKYSGAQLLKEIKAENKGVQVIMFTASNKAWNMRELNDIGANGYYIKESPEYVLSNEFSKDNYDEFIKTVDKCYKLDFLKEVDVLHKKWTSFITADKPLRSNSYRQFYDRTIAAFEISYDSLEKVTKDLKYFNFAFLTYFQILEDYVSQRDNFNYISRKECYVGTPGVRVIDDSTGSIIWKLFFYKDVVNGNYFEINDEPNDTSVQTLAKVSFVLAFKFGKDNAFLKKWSRLNNIRNTKAGHGGSGGYVAFSDIQELFEIVELFLTNP